MFDNRAGWVGDHVRRYVDSGGTRGHRFNGHDALLLTTRGRRTGRLRRTALYYGRDGDRYVLAATGGERPGTSTCWPTLPSSCRCERRPYPPSPARPPRASVPACGS